MMRGLCPNAHVDVFYTLKWDDKMNLPFYKGFIKSNIKYNESIEAWVLSSNDGSVNGEAVTDVHSMGTGALTWTFNKDICNTNNYDPMESVMTVCGRDQFTCDGDGACISMEERCDQFPNCQDFSDEANCKLVVLPENYVPDYAPFTVLENGDLKKVDVLLKVSFLAMFFSANCFSFRST